MEKTFFHLFDPDISSYMTIHIDKYTAYFKVFQLCEIKNTDLGDCASFKMICYSYSHSELFWAKENDFHNFILLLNSEMSAQNTFQRNFSQSPGSYRQNGGISGE